MNKTINKYVIYHKMDKRILRVILNSPFGFACDRMQNYDNKPIRFMYLGSVRLKPKLEREYNCKEDESKNI